MALESVFLILESSLRDHQQSLLFLEQAGAEITSPGRPRSVSLPRSLEPHSAEDKLVHLTGSPGMKPRHGLRGNISVETLAAAHQRTDASERAPRAEGVMRGEVGHRGPL